MQNKEIAFPSFHILVPAREKSGNPDKNLENFYRRVKNP